jgi:hypothetical protein
VTDERPDGEIIHDRKGIEAPADLDGVDLYDGCPNCGHDDGTSTFEQNPAGYFTCANCWTTWAGDPSEASLVDYCEVGNAE